MKKISTTLLLFGIIAIASTAQIPSGYYDKAEGKSGEQLIKALCEIIYPHEALTYNGLWNAFKTTDVDDEGYIIDMYSTSKFVPGVDQDKGQHPTVGYSYNREHSFPKSWFGGSVMPMYTDLNHLYPTDSKVNEQRSNYLFGVCEEGYRMEDDGNVAKGKLGYSTYTINGTSPYSGTVFEPDDELKGDFARTYFYMVTCYNNEVANWASNATISSAIDANSYPVWKNWYSTMLLEWSRLDPVSEKEIKRNNAVYSIQNNRNPYIDHPELAEYLWGNKKGMAWTSAPVVIPGDANDDGKVDVTDVTALINYILDNKYPINKANANVNNDRQLNVSDVTLIIQLILKTQ